MYQDKVSFKVGCEKHKRYNPVKEGQGGIKGGCVDCLKVYEVLRQVVGLRLAIMRTERQGE